MSTTQDKEDNEPLITCLHSQSKRELASFESNGTSRPVSSVLQNVISYDCPYSEHVHVGKTENYHRGNREIRVSIDEAFRILLSVEERPHRVGLGYQDFNFTLPMAVSEALYRALKQAHHRKRIQKQSDLGRLSKYQQKAFLKLYRMVVSDNWYGLDRWLESYAEEMPLIIVHRALALFLAQDGFFKEFRYSSHPDISKIVNKVEHEQRQKEASDYFEKE